MSKASMNHKAEIASVLQRWVYYVQAWKALSEEGKEHLQVVAQRLLYLRAGAIATREDSLERKKQNEHTIIVSERWEKVKELTSKLQTLIQGLYRCLRRLETFSADSSNTVLFATIPVSQFSPINEAFSRDLACKQHVTATFWHYASRDLLTLWIAVWWRQPAVDPIEVDFVVGAIVAELAADEYYIQLECNDRTELQRSTTTHNTNSELFSYLLS